MTKQEIRELTDECRAALNLLKSATSEVNKSLEAQTARLESRIANAPANLERDILNIASESIGKAISSALSGYSSPLTKLVEGVVAENSEYLKGVIKESFDKAVRMDEFKEAVLDSFFHRMSSSIVGQGESIFDKTFNELKNDAIFKSKLVLMVEGLVKEHIKVSK